MLNKTSKTTRNGGLLTTLTLNNAFVTLDGNQTESLRLIREGTSLWLKTEWTKNVPGGCVTT